MSGAADAVGLSVARGAGYAARFFAFGLAAAGFAGSDAAAAALGARRAGGTVSPGV